MPRFHGYPTHGFGGYAGPVVPARIVYNGLGEPVGAIPALASLIPSVMSALGPIASAVGPMAAKAASSALPMVARAASSAGPALMRALPQMTQMLPQVA